MIKIMTKKQYIELIRKVNNIPRIVSAETKRYADVAYKQKETMDKIAQDRSRIENQYKREKKSLLEKHETETHNMLVEIAYLRSELAFAKTLLKEWGADPKAVDDALKTRSKDCKCDKSKPQNMDDTAS